MADFRRCIYAIAVVALLLGLSSTAFAQTPAFTCDASAAVPPLVRAEGLTELVGDIVLNCTGGTPSLATALIPQSNVTVFLNTTVTSRIYNSSGDSEALLIIDEPGTVTNQTSAQRACPAARGTNCTFWGTGVQIAPNQVIQTGTPYTGGTSLGPTTAQNLIAYNVFEGVVSGNSVTFLGVPIDAPGTNGQRVLRITNIRANASALSANLTSPFGGQIPGQIQAVMAISGSTAVPINNNSLVVGVVQSGLAFSIRSVTGNDRALDPGELIRGQCNDLNNIRVALRTPWARLRYAEGFATSFKTRTASGAATSPFDAYVPPVVTQSVPGTIYNTESGFYNPLLGATNGNLATAGLADFGTRLKATFNNMPAGVEIYVTITNLNTNATRVARLVGTEIGSTFFPVPAVDTGYGSGNGLAYTVGNATTWGAVAQITPVSGTATAVWEVTAADPLASDNYDFGLWLRYVSNPTNNVPATGIGTISGSFAPTPPAFAAADGAKAQQISTAAGVIPRFVDTSKAANIINIILCRTNLLFPFVTNQAGFDTGIAISNTSTDPFGTAPQQGTCTLNFYGANAPAAITTATVTSAAGPYVNTALGMSPNFQGYIIAVCNFQYGHGFAFVTKVGTVDVAMGYLALVIPDPGRNTPFNSPNGVLTGGTGETLGY